MFVQPSESHSLPPDLPSVINYMYAFCSTAHDQGLEELPVLLSTFPPTSNFLLIEDSPSLPKKHVSPCQPVIPSMPTLPSRCKQA